MAELVHSAQNFMNAEDAIIAKKRKRVEKMEANPTRHSEQGPRPKKGRTEDKKDRDKKAGPSARSQQYTPLNMPLEQVLMQIKDDPSLKWPEKMKGDPNKRNRNKYCRFGRSTLNSWKAVTSTYHLSVKFPTDYGVGQVQGD